MAYKTSNIFYEWYYSLNESKYVMYAPYPMYAPDSNLTGYITVDKSTFPVQTYDNLEGNFYSGNINIFTLNDEDEIINLHINSADIYYDMAVAPDSINWLGNYLQTVGTKEHTSLWIRGSGRLVRENCSILPIFDENDTQAIQDYIDNGDDSGAINHQYLHPLKYDYTLYIDGTKNPSFTGVSKQHEGSDNAVTQHLFGCLGSNGLQYSRHNFYFDNKISKTWYNIKDMCNIAVAMPITVIEFAPVKDAGTINNDDIVLATINSNSEIVNQRLVSNNGHCTLTIVRGEPTEDDEENEVDNEKDSDDAIEDDVPLEAGNVLTRTYKVSETDLRSLGGFLFSATFLDNIKLLNQNPVDNILSIKMIPFNATGENGNIVIGNVDTGISSVKLPKTLYKKEIGTRVIGRQFNNFLDFTAIDVTIFLPFIGFKQLDASQVVGKNIKVVYAFDLIRGMCLAIISVYSESAKQFIPIQSYEGDCSVDVPLSSSNASRIAVGYLTNAIDCGVDIAASNPVGVIGDVTSGLLQEKQFSTNGIGSGCLMSTMTRDVFIILTRPQQINNSTIEGYASSNGFVNFQYGKIKDFKGFSKFENVKIENLNCLQEEEQEIYRGLESGVYIDE